MGAKISLDRTLSVLQTLHHQRRPPCRPTAWGADRRPCDG